MTPRRSPWFSARRDPPANGAACCGGPSVTDIRCPFCRCDPFHYEDIGVGFDAVAIVCCDLGIALNQGDKTAARILRDMRSHHPHAKARAKRMRNELES